MALPGQQLARRAANAAIAQAKTALGRARWSIAIYRGDDPLRLAPAPGVPCPVLTKESVSDVVASFVADPFMIQVDGGWHMFFEVLKVTPRGMLGVISHASSPDALRWTYDRVVLETGTHLSYPQVFTSGGDVYMLPENHAGGRVLLYRADPFPRRWRVAAELLSRPLFDCTVFERDGRWWMLAEERIESDTLRLFHAPALTGPWVEHPKSPVVRGDRRRSRPAGRVVATPERLIRFAQDGVPAYGTAVRAIEITELSPTAYAERELSPAPLFGPGDGWNVRGMHHVDVHRAGDGWIACADGWYRGLVDLAEVRVRAAALRGGR